MNKSANITKIAKRNRFYGQSVIDDLRTELDDPLVCEWFFQVLDKANLTKAERTALLSRIYGDTFRKIAKDFNRTPERIRQLEAVALRKAKSVILELES